MKKYFLILFLLAGCSGLNFPGFSTGANDTVDTGSLEPIDEVLISSGSGQLRPVARPEPPLSDEPDKAPAGQIGVTVASLDSPAEPGLWMKTPLVSSRQQAKIVAKNNIPVTVTLIPIEGERTAGSRLSLQAMQALGVSLADLVEVTVTAL